MAPLQFQNYGDPHGIPSDFSWVLHMHFKTNGDDEAKLNDIYATVKPQNRQWDIPFVKIKACENGLAARTEV